MTWWIQWIVSLVLWKPDESGWKYYSEDQISLPLQKRKVLDIKS